MSEPLPGQESAFPELEPVKPWNEQPRLRQHPKTEAAPATRQIIPSSMGKPVQVAPKLIPLLIDIDSVKQHPRNLRKHNIDAIMAAIDKYGIMSPVVVQQSTMLICKGNGTWKAAKTLGAEQIPASIVDIDDDTAWEYLLDDNKASDLADYDRVELTKSLTALAEAGKLGNTLWSLDDLEDLQAETGQLTVLEPQFAGDYALDAETLAARRARVTQNTGTKMRQTSVVLSVAQHEEFMTNVTELREIYGTTGVIQTVVEAVRREAELYRNSVTVQGVVGETEEETTEDLAARV